MTDEQLIQMAKEAFLPYEYKSGLPLYIPQLRRFAALVAAAERSQCAALCSRFAARSMSPAECADAIRARGEK